MSVPVATKGASNKALGERETKSVGGVSMTIKCPYCGATYDIEEDECGHRVRCEVCGNRFVIGYAPPLEKIQRSSPQKSNSSKRTTDGDKGQKKLSWEGVGIFIMACVIVCRSIFGCHGKTDENQENVQPQVISDSAPDRLSRSAKKRLGKTSIPQRELNVLHQRHNEKGDDDDSEGDDDDAMRTLVLKADLLVQKRQREDSILAEKVKIAEQKQMRQMEVLLAEMKRNGGDRDAAMRVAMSKVELTSEDMACLGESVRLSAKGKGDPSIIRDFEAAFEQRTGLVLNMKTKEEEEEEDTLTRALAYVEKRYQEGLRSYGLTESVLQDRARIKAYKRELIIQ